MSFFNITDITPAGALCNAMDAARERESRGARHQVSASAEDAKHVHTAHSPLATIREILGDALRHIGRSYRTETA